ncbi:MAG: N-formylglutamate amidohydrolase, partial [Pseudomonadota bacterium]
AERAEIVETVWRPYHRRIRIELDRLVEAHGFACLWDAHSIAPALPRLFAGTLPDLNLGSFDGAACPPAVAGSVLAVAHAAGRGLTSILDGRFKGGYITRRYGRPDTRIHALQMEIAQSAYMVDGSWQGPDPSLDFAKAETLRPVLRGMMTTFLSAAADHAESLA